MARYTAQRSAGFDALFKQTPLRRGLVWGSMIIGALLAFEMFNYSTTEFALHDLLGDLSFLSVKWSTILALAFCGIDFAGIARLFTPEEGDDEPKEVWYLFGAWLLAATMNAMLTWWGVSIAILGHETLGNEVINRATLLEVVPIFVATMVWLSRVLIIGTFSVAGERLFSQAEIRESSSYRKPAAKPKTYKKPAPQYKPAPSKTYKPAYSSPSPKPAFRPAPKPQAKVRSESAYTVPEPTYHPVGLKSRNGSGGNGGTKF